MDEIFGYFPPHPANPPTKRPLLTLLKQARAQGVGVVLATQNPVDLDYKGLANIGTWLVGTLQTEQDRDRLREGLTGADVKAAQVDRLLDATKKRVFLLHDVHRKGPSLLHSRWAMSYLRGPLTREEISRLMKGRAAAQSAKGAPGASAAAPPLLPPPLKNHYLSKYGGELADACVFVKYAVRYKGRDEQVGTRAWPLATSSASESLETEALEVAEADLQSNPPSGLRFSDLPSWLSEAGAKSLERAIKDRLADKLAATVFADPVTRESSAPGETREAFAARLQAEGGGAGAAKLRDQLEKKKRDLAIRQQDLSGRKGEKWMAIGSAVLQNIGLFTGRKRTISGTGTILSKNRMEDNAEARVEALQADVAALERQLESAGTVDPARFEEERVVPPRTGVKVLRYDVVWVY
jgi:hypothetical protein